MTRAVAVLRTAWVAVAAGALAGAFVFVRYEDRASLATDAPAAAFAALVTAGGVFLFAIGLSRLAASRLDAWDVRRAGRDATATVLEVLGTELVVRRRALLRLRVRVEPADGTAPFEARMEGFAEGLAAGARLAVRYDPARPWRVTPAS